MKTETTDTKSIAQIIVNNSNIPASLVSAVVNQLGSEGDELAQNLKDIANNGASGGWSGFIYYTETVKFFRENKKDILKLAKEMADDIGEKGLLEMVQGFNCLGSGQYPNRKPDYTLDEIGEAIYGSGDEGEIIQNALAWYALEEVARVYNDYCESQG